MSDRSAHHVPDSTLNEPGHTWKPIFGRVPDDAVEVATAAVATGPADPAKVPILGIPLALTDYERTMDWIDEMVSTRGRGYVSAAAVHLVMVSQEDAETRDAVLGCALAVPDGQPLVWAMRALGHDASRVYGPELMARYCERSARTGNVHVPLRRPQPGRARAAARSTCASATPGVKIVGGYSPPFRELDRRGARPGRPTTSTPAAPTSCGWASASPSRRSGWPSSATALDAPVLVGVGAAFDFHAGLVPQAPNWMQRMGLEWLYRLAHEPRRLWRRYLRYNPRFVSGFARQYARTRFLGRGS